jgi:integrase
VSTVLDNLAVFPLPIKEEPQEEQPKRDKDNDGLHKRRGIWHTRVKIAGKWKELSLGTRNYNEARRKRQEKVDEFEERQKLPDLATLPFSKASALWLGERLKLVAKGTYKIEKQRLAPLAEKLGNLRLIDITSQHLRAYQLTRIEQVSPRTCNLELKVVRQLLKTARLWSRLADDIKPLKENSKGPGRALTPEQESKLFDCAQKSLYLSAAFYAGIVAANTTMRGCELKGLQLSDVDLVTRTVTIRRNSTKTDAGCRLIPLNNAAVWALTKLSERAKLLKANEPEHYLFPAFRCKHTKEGKAAGSGYDPTKPMVSWRSGWRTLTTNAGLKGLRFHDMRHHSITKLAEAGVPDQTLMSIAGHVNKAMLDHYSHVRLQAKRTAVEALDTFKIPSSEAAETESNVLAMVN